MRIVFMGTPEFSVPVLNALAAAGHEIACVYCQPPRPAGRGKKDRPSPVHARAEALGLTVRHPINFKDPKDIDAFADLNADIAVVVAYGLILPQSVLDAPRLGCLNIHASLLPRWRGAAPIHRAIMAGDEETGVCIMQMEAGLDTGPVMTRQTTRIEPRETTQDLHDRLSQMGAALIVETLDALPEPVAQNAQGVSYAAKIDKSEARLDWRQPAAHVDRQIRGLSPFPGAWFEHSGLRIKVLRSVVTTGEGRPGTVLHDPLRVVCASGHDAVELIELQRSGKSGQGAKQFLNGCPIPAGTILE
jgi:methionyl-tRNA formyltransferase